MLDDRDAFEAQCRDSAARMGADEDVRSRSQGWLEAVSQHRYSYNFRWLGLPIIQFPQDIVALQELTWAVKPDLVVETGVARGGSAILYASILELIGGPGRVIAIDIDIRAHNRRAIEEHPLAGRVELLEGSSVDPAIVDRVAAEARTAERVMVVLDSNHTEDHVLSELRAYGPLVTPGSYLVVLDTVIERMPANAFPDRPWGPGDNPMTAVARYLEETDRFETDRAIDDRLLVSVAPGGYLRCVGPEGAR